MIAVLEVLKRVFTRCIIGKHNWSNMQLGSVRINAKESKVTAYCCCKDCGRKKYFNFKNFDEYIVAKEKPCAILLTKAN